MVGLCRQSALTLFTAYATIKQDSVQRSDVNFYFFHWLTDLAGAEPTPLRGSGSMFSVPHWPPLVHRFFPCRQARRPERDSHFEEFLVRTWEEARNGLGPLPRGASAIAKMRLITQVQHLPLQQRTIAAFSELPPADQEVLGFEMGLTGCRDQNYAIHTQVQGGPVFLVYYSPAFMRSATSKDASGGLRMLAEIYRQARVLWPFHPKKSSEHVTIRIEQIHMHLPDDIADGYLSGGGEAWLLVKKNAREAIVEQHPIYSLTSAMPVEKHRILAFWRKEDEDTDESFITELKQMQSGRNAFDTVFDA